MRQLVRRRLVRLQLVQHGLGPYVACFESCSAEELAELDDSALKQAFGIANATDRARILAVVRARLLLASKIARQLDQLNLGAEVVDLSAAGVDDTTAARFASLSAPGPHGATALPLPRRDITAVLSVTLT